MNKQDSTVYIDNDANTCDFSYMYNFTYLAMDPLKFFKCLSDDTRLKSVMLVFQQQEACVCDLVESLQLEQPKISRHLAELRKCGILQDERRGKWVYYRLHPELPEWALGIIQTATQNNPDYFAAPLNRLQKCC